MNRGFGDSYQSSAAGYLPTGQAGRKQETGNQKADRPSYLTPKPQTKEHTPSPDFKPSDTSNLRVGQKVEHQKFGFGEVMKMEGAAHNPVATVKFELNGEKKIMLNYARLRIVE
jgi:DNA helicase-2/ATP-dependent DNA helicase PcrA